MVQKSVPTPLKYGRPRGGSYTEVFEFRAVISKEIAVFFTHDIGNTV